MPISSIAWTTGRNRVGFTPALKMRVFGGCQMLGHCFGHLAQAGVVVARETECFVRRFRRRIRFPLQITVSVDFGFLHNQIEIENFLKELAFLWRPFDLILAGSSPKRPTIVKVLGLVQRAADGLDALFAAEIERVGDAHERAQFAHHILFRRATVG